MFFLSVVNYPTLFTQWQVTWDGVGYPEGVTVPIDQEIAVPSDAGILEAYLWNPEMFARGEPGYARIYGYGRFVATPGAHYEWDLQQNIIQEKAVAPAPAPAKFPWGAVLVGGGLVGLAVVAVRRRRK